MDNLFEDTREIFFIDEDEISEKHLSDFLKSVRILEKTNKPIVMHLCSVGGDRVVSGGIYDIIYQSKCPFIIIGYGLVASSASIIFQAAADKGYRILTPNCSMIVHEGLISLENNPKSAMSQIEENNRLVNLMYEIYSNACKSGEFFKEDKVPKIKSYIKRKLSIKEDWILDSSQSVYYGFADAVLGSKDYETLDKIRGYL